MRRTQEQILKELIACRAKEENGVWIGYRTCPECEKEIEYFSNKRYYLLRDIEKMQGKLCLKCSLTGKRNPFFNKKHSQETKDQISKSRIGKATGEQNSMANPIHRETVSKRLTEEYASGRLDFQKEIQSKTSKQRHREGRCFFAPVSKSENEINNIFKELNIPIVPQFRIDTLRYDFHINNTNILIEYNGDYWHCNPKKYNANYFNHKKQMFAKEIWERDEKKKKLAEDSGYKLITIWESDFKNNKKEIIQNLIQNG